MAATRSGFIGLAGRPNVGKSTLANALVGAKVAIVSDRPQTTRRAVRAIATEPGSDPAWQMVLVDLPGVQKPRDVLTERMQRRVEREVSDSDAIVFVLNAAQGIGAGDRFIATTMLKAKAETPVICAVNKIDTIKHHELVAVLAAAAELEVVDEVFPVSAARGTGLDALRERLIELLPDGPLMYPAGESSDETSEVHLAELVREQILRRTREEIPHAVDVEVAELSRREDGLIEVRADVWAETDSQKAILIGKRGRMVREFGAAARREIESELGEQVFLDLRVRVRPRWRRDESLLDRLGID